MSVVLSGVQKEHYIHQAMCTHCRKGAELLKWLAHLATPLGPSHRAYHTWDVCDRGLRTPYTLSDGYQREDVGEARLQPCHLLGARDPWKCLRGRMDVCRG